MTARVLLLALLLSGCGAVPKPEPEVRTVEVKVPVRKPCVPSDLPPPPAYADAALTRATPADDSYRITAQANQERRARLARLEPIIATCR